MELLRRPIEGSSGVFLIVGIGSVVTILGIVTADLVNKGFYIPAVISGTLIALYVVGGRRVYKKNVRK